MTDQPTNPYDKLYQKENYFGYKEWLYAPYIAAVSAKAGLRHDSRVLDVGCGQGFFSNLLHRNSSNVLGIDLSATGISIARSKFQSPGLEFQETDIRGLDSEVKFDCIFVRSLSLYNSQDFATNTEVTDQLLQRLYPKGTLIFLYNTCLNPRKKGGDWKYHSYEDAVRHFSKYSTAEVYFTLKIETLLLGKRSFNKPVTTVNRFASRTAGLRGELACFVSAI